MHPARARVLCLHALYQNGEAFRSKGDVLFSRMQQHCDLVFADAPTSLQPKVIRAPHANIRPRSAPAAAAVAEPKDFRCWWPGVRSPSPPDCSETGVEQAFARTCEFLLGLGPFDGVVGLSQGGALAGMICTNEWHRTAGWSPRFALLLSAYVSPLRCHQPYYDSGFAPHVCSLHIWGKSDCVVTPSKSQELQARMCSATAAAAVEGQPPGARGTGYSARLCPGTPDGRAATLEHDGGHTMPESLATVGPVLDWLRHVAPPI